MLSQSSSQRQLGRSGVGRAGLAPVASAFSSPRPGRPASSRVASQAISCAMSPSLGASSFGGKRLTVRGPRSHAAAACGRRRCLVVRSMFEKFTEKAIKVVMLAQEEARRMNHNFVGTEQLLLGLLGETTGVACKVLKEAGVGLSDARREVEKLVGRGSGFVPVEIPFTPRAKRVLEMSLEEARQLGHSYIGTEHILLGLLKESEGVAGRVLQAMAGGNAAAAKIRAAVLSAILDDGNLAGAGASSSSSSSSSKWGSLSGGKAGDGKTPTLEEYAVDLTAKAAEGKLDPVVGRAKEIQRVIQILGRRSKNNPCLIGEPGVGKTAVAEGLAQLIAAGDVPDTLAGKRVFALDMGLLIAGTKYRGEFEERLKKLVDEIKSNPGIILMIDEVHTLVGAGASEGAIDAANLLKPALARGELQCIGATTLDEYRKHIEKDPALERRFQPVTVGEPSVEETFEVLQGLRPRYEAHHKLRYSDEALMAAAKLSSQYISDRFLPDKAIDLVDEAGSRVRLRHLAMPEAARELNEELKAATAAKEAAVKACDYVAAGQLRDTEAALRARLAAVVSGARELSAAEAASVAALSSVSVGEGSEDGGSSSQPLVTAEDIASIVAQWTGIPLEKVSSDETDKLLQMEATLHGRVVGQGEAVTAIARAVRRARVGLKNPNRPTASFVFAGPTGVGKTELAKALATYYFGSEEAMIRLDMSEFMERHEVAKLIGSPPGYVGYDEGGQLTEAVRRRPYSLVLFDEIEKAHPDVFNMMLQILEDGRLTDSKGRTVDFKNTMIILTSNVGARLITGQGASGRGMGFALRPGDDADDVDAALSDSRYGRVKSLVNEELKSYFRPEFLNRLDEIIVFRQLTRTEVGAIADVMLREVVGRAATKGLRLELTPAFKERLVNEGYEPEYGARPLRRAIMRLVEDSLAEHLLSVASAAGSDAAANAAAASAELQLVILDAEPQVDGDVVVEAGGKRTTVFSGSGSRTPRSNILPAPARSSSGRSASPARTPSTMTSL